VNERRAYCGLLDDFAVRQQDGRPITTVSGLNDHLALAVIAGDPLVVNDGYLLNNPALRRAILQPEVSPFRALVEAGFVKILSRNEGAIESLAETMANQNIVSAQQLVEEPGYVNEYQPALARWSTYLNSGYFDWSRQWPSRRSDGVYRKLASESLDRLAGGALVHDAVVDSEGVRQFRCELGESVGSRTAWEETARALVGRDKLTLEAYKQLMATANEVYQYTWGCLLADKYNPMSVQTRLPQLLSEKLDRGTTDQAVEARGPVSLFAPDIKIARKGIGHQWDLLVQSVNTSSAASKGKRDYLATLARYYRREDVSDKEMEVAAHDYSQVLARAFGHEKRVQTGLDLTFAAMAIGTSVALTGPLGLAIGIGVTAGGLATSHVTPVHNLINRLGQARSGNWVREVGRIDRSATSTFELDLGAASSILEGVPIFDPSAA
jgi:hypothetical protein